MSNDICLSIELVFNQIRLVGGRNTGRVGTIMSRERHPGSFDIVHVKDSNGHVFATRLAYIFVIGKVSCSFICDYKLFLELVQGV